MLLEDVTAEGCTSRNGALIAGIGLSRVRRHFHFTG